jgi:protocatechuate 3,4-dioxygenase beta subunit
MVALDAGRSVTDLEFRAIRVGIVSGRIVDTAGQPLAGIAVALIRKTYDQNGGASFGSEGGAATTDERGEYRVPVLPHAGYYLLARGGGSGANAAPRYAGSIFPGTSDLAAAATIDVRSAATETLKDFALAPQRLFAVRGRVVDGATGRPPADAAMWITTTSLLGGETITAMPTYSPAAGTSETRVSEMDAMRSA